MKTVKRLFSLALALILVLGLATTAMADDSYTITINNGVKGETYNAYKVFDVTLADNNTKFAYTIDSDGDGSWCWNTLISGLTADSKGVYTNSTYGLVFTPSANDSSVYVVTTATNISDSNAAALASALNAVTKPTVAGSVTYGENTKTISVSKLGYYLVDTSLGSLCSLDTTATNVEIYEKNSVPTIDKKVKDSADTDYAKTADVHGGDTVDYQLTVNTGSNQNTTDSTGVDGNYVIVDTLPAGVVMSADQIAALSVKTGEITWTKGEATNASADYTVTYTAPTDTDTAKLTITLIAREAAGETAASKLWEIAENTNIVITYSATMTKDAVSDAALTNTAKLTYKQQEATSTASVYSWSFNTLKYTGELTGNYSKLAGATFQLLDGNNQAMKFISEGNNVYRYDSRLIATGNVTLDGVSVTVVDSITTTEDGVFKIEGLDAGGYKLRETAAPAGYNILTEDVSVGITSAADNTGTTLTATVADTSTVEKVAYIAIQNNSGAELPSTGGMGTTLFYVIGGILVLGAVVLLVTKKRAGSET